MNQPPSLHPAEWSALLVTRSSPRWVPHAVAQVMIEAHGDGRTVGATPQTVTLDLTGQRIMPADASSPTAIGAAADLALCLGDLLALAVEHPDAARHVFQQSALLWRAYREGSGLPQRSDFEETMVSQVVASLHARYPERWMQRIVRANDRGAIVALHELIDALFEAVRDMR